MFEKSAYYNSYAFQLNQILPDSYKNHELMFDQKRSLYTGYPAQVIMRNIKDYGGNFLATLKQTETGKLWKVKIKFYKKRVFVRDGIKATQRDWEDDSLVFMLYEDERSVQYIPSGEFFRKEDFVTVPHFAIVE